MTIFEADPKIHCSEFASGEQVICLRAVAYLGGAVVRPPPPFGLTMLFWPINVTFFLSFCRRNSMM
jgi:hypothetical protein